MFHFSRFFKKRNHGFIERDNLSEKFFLVDKQNGTDIHDTRNLKDLPRLVLIDEECGNLKLVNDNGEFTRNINQKKSDILH